MLIEHVVERLLEAAIVLKDALPVIATLIAAAVGAWSAMRGAERAARLSLEHKREAASIALHTEIAALRDALAENLRLPTDTGWVRFFAKSSPASACPIYMQLASDLGTLDRECIEPVVKFYSSLLTSDTVKIDDGNDIAWLISINDLDANLKLAECAHKSFSGLKDYGVRHVRKHLEQQATD